MQKTNGYCTLAKHGLTAALITKGAYAIMRTERLRGVEIRWTFLVFFGTIEIHYDSALKNIKKPASRQVVLDVEANLAVSCAHK